MKRFLSLALVLVLVFGAIMPSFAEEVTDPALLEETKDLAAYGILEGDGTGYNEEGPLTRAAMAKILAFFYGEEEAAETYALTEVFSDVTDTELWYYGWVSYAGVKGWMNGDAGIGGTFRPNDEMNAQEVNQLMIRVLGYDDVEWADVNAKAEELEVAVTAADNSLVLRGEAFKAIRNVLDATPMDAEMTLGSSLELPGYVAPEPPVVEPVALEVESVTAINTKQIQVKFNTMVDKAKAETAASYTVGGTAFGTASLQEDGMTVIATMAGDTSMTNAGTAAIKVLKAVGLEADYSETINVVDVTVPTLLGVEAIGAKSLKLTFSEPVYNGTNGTIATTNFTVKSGIYTYVVQSATANYADRSVVVTVGTDLIEGDLTIKTNAAGMVAGSVRDFAGLIVIPVETVYAYAKDTTVPEVELVSVNKATGVAKVTFSKPVYGSNVVMYHSVNGTAAYGTAAVTKTSANAATDWEFTFTNALPSGTLNFYLVNSNVAAEQLTDLFGVKVPNQTFTYEVVADTTAPTVSKVTVNTNASIDIKFSEAIASAEATKTANFELLKPDGTALTFTPSLQAADTVRLTASLVDNTTYTLTVKAMKDAAGNAMAAEYTTQAVVGDNVHPTIPAGGTYITANNTLYVTFSEDMNADDISKKSNYLVKPTAAGSFTALGADDTVTVISPSKVKITWDDANLAANGEVRIGAVRDLAGKTLVDSTTFSSDYTIVSDALTFTADLIATNKVKIKFNKVIGAFDASEFTVAGTTWLAIESNEVVSGVSHVTLVLADHLAANATPAVAAVAVPANTKSAEGTVVTGGLSVNAADKVAPTVKNVVFVNNTTIKVVFTEGLESDYFAPTGVNGFSVTGGSAELTGAQPSGADTDTVILTGTSLATTTDIAFSGSSLYDLATAPNKLADFTYTDTLTAYTIDATTTQTAATGTLTVDTNPTANDTMTIGATVYTFVATVDFDAAGEIELGGDVATTQANILAALAGTDGVNTANVYVTASAFAADATTLTAKTAYDGAFGNTVATTETFTAGTNVFAAGTLSGGQDVVVVNTSVDYTAANIDNADATTDFALAGGAFTGTTVETDADTLTITITAATAQVKGDDINVVAGEITADSTGYEFSTVAVEVQ